MVEPRGVVAKSCQGGGPLLGDAQLGAVLRALRAARRLTLVGVAQRAGCVESTVSLVECGHRRLQPWLAQEFDRIYETGGAIAALAAGAGGKSRQGLDAGPRSDVFVVVLPRGGISVPLSRRETLAALGVGISSGKLQGQFERALDDIRPDSDLLKHFEDAFNGFQSAARMLRPRQVMDGLLGNVAILDGLRRRAPERDGQRYLSLQARYAELLSWLSEEAGDLSGAMYWIDRASQWAQAASWQAMVEYGFVRRSQVVISFSGDGRRAVDQAHHVFEISNASPRMKGLAARQISYGYALTGNKDASYRSLDEAVSWLDRPVRDDDILVGQRSVGGEDMFAFFQATCRVYLGHGASAIRVLEPRLVSLSRLSLRLVTIACAKLALAYAHAGQPAEACSMAWETLHGMEQVDSLSARSELCRTVRVLDRWHGRHDVQDLTHRLGSRVPVR